VRSFVEHESPGLILHIIKEGFLGEFDLESTKEGS
jgi:hypothetical protein